MTDERQRHIAQLRALAAEWRQRAAETADPHYQDLMLRTAAEIDTHIAALEKGKTP